MPKHSKKPVYYFHIHNGGITLTLDIDAERGACLVVDANHYGIQTNEMRIPVRQDSLQHLAQFFQAISKIPLSPHDPVQTDGHLRESVKWVPGVESWFDESFSFPTPGDE